MRGSPGRRRLRVRRTVVLLLVVLAPAALLLAPSGPWRASPARPPALRLVALGDSVAAGTACGCTSFVGLLGRPAGAGRPARSTSDLAVPGLTSAGLLAQLSDPAVSAEVGAADDVVLLVGANDFASGTVGTSACSEPLSAGCYGPGLQGLRSTLTRVLSRVHSLSRARVVLLDYWAVFQDGDVARQQGPAYVQRGDALTVAVDEVIARCAAEEAGTFVDLYQPFRQDGDDTALLAPDGDHPDAAGHELIARVLQAALDGAPAG